MPDQHPQKSNEKVPGFVSLAIFFIHVVVGAKASPHGNQQEILPPSLAAEKYDLEKEAPVSKGLHGGHNDDGGSHVRAPNTFSNRTCQSKQVAGTDIARASIL